MKWNIGPIVGEGPLTTYNEVFYFRLHEDILALKVFQTDFKDQTWATPRILPKIYGGSFSKRLRRMILDGIVFIFNSKPPS